MMSPSKLERGSHNNRTLNYKQSIKKMIKKTIFFELLITISVRAIPRSRESSLIGAI